tara:strand:+ start:1204 stop:1947 length:744 start_codon:yes stop_codon:yes gene_type:complete
MNKPITKTEAAILSSRSVYWMNVKSVSDGMAKTERAIKASTNAKLGKVVNVGRLKGARIFTLTLEERATCDNSCAHWKTCFGNNMPFATRYKMDDALLIQIESDLEFYNAKGKSFLVRLHVLGDFPSVEYVAFWARMLCQFENLNVYGYTARLSGTLIGDAILSLRSPRFMVRQSGQFDGSNMSALSFDDVRSLPTVDARKAIVCPTQIAKRGEYELAAKGIDTLTPNCGTCGLCWTTPKNIVFLTH